MGYFSWNTCDTQESISNKRSVRGAFPVKMLDDKGNVWHEPCYEGYGVFGGKDYYELLAEMNGKQGRSAGINLAFAQNPVETIKYPKLVRQDCSLRWEQLPNPTDCCFQGFFY